MSAKHTPGPWTFDGPPHNQIVWSSAENRICFMAHSNGLDEDRDIATARLIVAAPELLAACVAFLERYEVGSRADTDYVANSMRAAVTRATGAP